MKIGLFTDPHYSDKIIPSDNRYHRRSYDKISEAMSYFKDENVDLVVCLGDLTDDCENVNDNPKALKEISNLINSFGIKFYSLMGNHDYLSFTKEEFNEYTNGAYPPFSIETEKSMLIFLDCNYEVGGKPYQKRNVDWTNTFLPKEQLDNLKEKLKTPKDVYIFSHQSIDPTIEQNHVVKNTKEIREVLNNKNTKMVIQGHFHPGKDTLIGKIRYYTLAAMCESENNLYEILEVL